MDLRALTREDDRSSRQLRIPAHHVERLGHPDRVALAWNEDSGCLEVWPEDAVSVGGGTA